MAKILITGASGKVGSMVVEKLKQNPDLSLRLISRSSKKLKEYRNLEIMVADYGDVESLDTAFKNIDIAFIVSGYAPPGERAKLHKNAINAAVRAGVHHLVYLSFQGASPNSKFPMSRDHFETEEYIFNSGISYTILRDSLYMDLIPEMFNDECIMKGPGGDGKVAWVAREEVSAVVAAILQESDRFKGVFTLTGPEAISLRETAALLNELTGENYTYQDETVEQAFKWRRNTGAPEWELNTWVGSYLAISAGELSMISNDVLNITQNPPQRLEAYLKKILSVD
jgi:uncharacterized protein YbjT (DUF2867 family)